MPKNHRRNICNINTIERAKRAVYSAVLFVVSWYVWYTLLVNKFGGWNKIVLVVPLYFAFLTAYEAVVGWCVLKNKRHKKSILIHILSVASAVVVSVALVFA